jgi:hypothetical protein
VPGISVSVVTQTVAFDVVVQPGDVVVKLAVIGNPVTGVVLEAGVTLSVRLCVDDEIYCGVRACELVLAACGITIFRLVAVETAFDDRALLAAGTVVPPPEHAASKTTRTATKQRVIRLPFGRPSAIYPTMG